MQLVVMSRAKYYKNLSNFFQIRKFQDAGRDEVQIRAHLLDPEAVSRAIAGRHPEIQSQVRYLFSFKCEQ